MKYRKIAILVIVMLSTVFKSYPQSLLISCEEIIKSQEIEFVDKWYISSDDYLDVKVSVPQIKKWANEEARLKINSLLSDNTEEWINRTKKVVEEFLKDYPVPNQPYILATEYEVTDINRAISFYIDYYQYTGGAHGSTTKVSYTLDKESGENLKLNDLFKENYNYKSIVDNCVKKQIDKNKDFYFTGSDGFQGINEDTEFYIKDDDLIIYYQSYEIAPYATGLPEFKVPIKLFENNFKYVT